MKSLLLLFSLILASCITSSTPEGKTLPVLASPARATAWGSPTVSKTSEGYEMAYQNPSNASERLVIKGSRKMFYGLTFPPDIKGQKTMNGRPVKTNTPQVWQKVQITGQPAFLYQSHSPMDGRNARYKIIGEQLNGPGGVFGYYAIELEGSNNQVRPWISELRFIQ